MVYHAVRSGSTEIIKLDTITTMRATCRSSAENGLKGVGDKLKCLLVLLVVV